MKMANRTKPPDAGARAELDLAHVRDVHGQCCDKVLALCDELEATRAKLSLIIAAGQRMHDAIWHSHDWAEGTRVESATSAWTEAVEDLRK